jgi:hypothetical protein
MKTFLPINLKPILILAFSALFSLQTYAITRYVKTVATGTGDGSTWANASADIQAMIVASASGDEVWIAAGLYKPLKDGSGNTSPTNVQNKVFWLKSGVKLYGGFSGIETLTTQRVIATNKTIFSGDIDNNDTNSDGNNINEIYTDIQGTNVYQLLALYSCDNTTVVDGIIFTGAVGASTGAGQTINGFNFTPNFGSAITIYAAFPTIRNCVFSGNTSFYGATYWNNVGGANPVTVTSCIYTGNNTTYGGGMFLHRGNSIINNVVFLNNTATYGGAFNISSNMPAGNTISFTNCTMVNNTSTTYNAMRIENGTISFVNDIMYNATPVAGGLISKSGGTLTSSYSILQNSGANSSWNSNYGTDGGNNYDLNPLFLNIASITGVDSKYFTADDGLSLTSCSPAIETGTNSGILTTDIVGNTRPYSAGVTDMGAYEFQGASTIPANATSVATSSNAITCGQTVTLSATCAIGTLTWYGSYTATTSVGTGTNLVVSPLTNPSFFYASCETSSTCVSLLRVTTPSIAVTLPPDPTNVTVNNTSICPSTQVSLSATCSTGTPEWYNGTTVVSTATPFTPTVTATTTYSVKCRSGNCLSNAINASTINVLGAPTNVTLANAHVCAGQSETFTATCAVGTVQWYSSSNTGSLVGTGSPFTTTPAPNASGYYHYYVTCSNGTCTSNINLGTVNSFYFTPAPTAVAANQTSVCGATTISLSATCALGIVRWYDATTSGNQLGTGSPLSQTPSVTTTYYAECYDTFSTACSSFRNSVQVVVSLPVTTPTSVVVDKVVICPSTSISLSATCATGVVTWYSQSTGGTALGTGSILSQSPATTITYYVDCESGACTPSARVATSQVVVMIVGSNLNLTANISGTSIQASSNTITATNTILTGANVQYVANNSITLNPQAGGGFQVNSGAVFVARITPLTSCN